MCASQPSGTKWRCDDTSRQWDAETGQLLLDFEPQPTCGRVASILTPREERAREDAVDLFYRARALEDDDLDAAEGAYRQALDRVPDHRCIIESGCILVDSERILTPRWLSTSPSWRRCEKRDTTHLPSGTILLSQGSAGREAPRRLLVPSRMCANANAVTLLPTLTRPRRPTPATCQSVSARPG